jgi:hypothetical protein
MKCYTKDLVIGLQFEGGSVAINATLLIINIITHSRHMRSLRKDNKVKA